MQFSRCGEALADNLGHPRLKNTQPLTPKSTDRNLSYAIFSVMQVVSGCPEVTNFLGGKQRNTIFCREAEARESSVLNTRNEAPNMLSHALAYLRPCRLEGMTFD